MALIRRLPYRTHFGLEQQLRDMQRLMTALASQGDQRGGDGDGQGDDGDGRSSGVFSPSADVYHHDGELVIELELPGVDIDNDVAVSVHDGVLTVRGQRTSERTDERAGAYLTERRSGSFSRNLSLPDGVDPDEIEADYSDGVLSIRVPVPEDDGGSNQPRHIAIGRGDDGDKKLTAATEGSSSSQGSDHNQGSAPKSGKSKSGKSKTGNSKSGGSKTGTSSSKSSGSKSKNEDNAESS